MLERVTSCDSKDYGIEVNRKHENLQNTMKEALNFVN